MDPQELSKRLKGNDESKMCFLSDLSGYDAWWEKHPDELDTVRECMDEVRIAMHPDELNDDHTELFDEFLADTRHELGLE